MVSLIKCKSTPRYGPASPRGNVTLSDYPRLILYPLTSCYATQQHRGRGEQGGMDSFSYLFYTPLPSCYATATA